MRVEDFLDRVDRRSTSECWPWTGASFETHGNRYGILSEPRGRRRGRQVMAHRRSYELFCGPIPDGHVLDHACRNGLCVNPAHLEPVSNTENILRGVGAPALNARKTHCLRGHALSPENVRLRRDGRRVCRACENERSAARYRRP